MEENVNVSAQNEASEPEKPDFEALYKELAKERDKLKTSFDTASSDLARVKRELSEHRTKEENDKAEREEADRLLHEELENLRTERRVGIYTNRLLGVGMDAEAAKTCAEVLPDGIPDSFFDGIKKLIAEITANVRAELLKEQPKMTPGMPPSSQDVAKSKDDAIRRAMGLK